MMLKMYLEIRRADERLFTVLSCCNLMDGEGFEHSYTFWSPEPNVLTLIRNFFDENNPMLLYSSKSHKKLSTWFLLNKSHRNIELCLWLLLNKSYVNNFLWLLDEYNTSPLMILIKKS